jgi:hypothetical protein
MVGNTNPMIWPVLDIMELDYGRECSSCNATAHQQGMPIKILTKSGKWLIIRIVIIVLGITLA